MSSPLSGNRKNPGTISKSSLLKLSNSKNTTNKKSKNETSSTLKKVRTAKKYPIGPHSSIKTEKAVQEETKINEYQHLYTSGDSGGTYEVGQGASTPITPSHQTPHAPEELRRDSAGAPPQLPISIGPNHLSLRNKTNLISQATSLTSQL